MCISSGPKSQPAPPPPPAPPTVPNKTNKAKELAAARGNEAQKAALASGRDSTILTGPLGDQSQANTRQKTLLGQ